MTPSRLGFRSVRVHFGAFDFTVECIVGPRANVLRYVRWRMDDGAFEWSGEGLRGAHFERLGYAPIVWIPRRPRTPAEHGTLAHELMHVVRGMLVDWAGMPLNSDTDEAFCHAMGHATRTILEGLGRKG